MKTVVTLRAESSLTLSIQKKNKKNRLIYYHLTVEKRLKNNHQGKITTNGIQHGQGVRGSYVME